MRESSTRKSISDAEKLSHLLAESANSFAHKRRQKRAENFFRFYNGLLSPLIPALGAYTLWRRFKQGKSAASLRGQWGIVPAEVMASLRGDSSTRIWIHAVSVGETMAARPVARALRTMMPQCEIVLSVTTDTGFETAQVVQKSGEVDAVFHFPLDTAFTSQRALNAIRPHAFLTMETELWPNFLHLARRAGVKTFLVNGRVSDNLLRLAPRLGRIWRWMSGNLDVCLMRSKFDANRLAQLGVAQKRIFVTGDVKLDVVPDVSQNQLMRNHWRRVLEIGEDAPLWVAGSTHSGEDEIVLRTYQNLRKEIPNLRLLLAPRHIERAKEILEIAENLSVPIARRTESTKDANANVILLDTVGELADLYAACDVAFVGGSLVERGGHNLLEPVLRGVPVVFGPHVANFRQAARFATESGAGKEIGNAEELEKALLFWLGNPTERATVTENAREMLREHSGAAQRVAQIVKAVLENADSQNRVLESDNVSRAN